MTAAGKTYDPLYLAEAHARGIRGDPVRAAYWYRKASDAGDSQADVLMKRLMEKFAG
jgi:TPR repeat protein